MVKRQNKGCGIRLQTSSLQVVSLSFDLLSFLVFKSSINSGTPATASPAAKRGCPRVLQHLSITRGKKLSFLSSIPSLAGLLPGQAGRPHPLINVPKDTPVISENVLPPVPGTCPKPSARCFEI